MRDRDKLPALRAEYAGPKGGDVVEAAPQYDPTSNTGPSRRGDRAAAPNPSDGLRFESPVV